jgi:hypothetical protein
LMDYVILQLNQIQNHGLVDIEVGL